ncbi:Uncharacterised protein [BD1-7 clade bacterium]|uniref:Sulfotransferase family protein n=1 Tax=BD1-7 clade bacterium TaxID=2029982 RepID=A0A5S9QNJ6_9GAMM|nr:Uncharacterised protein [BD1-7 clade bacterium]CAA0121464.1 Uncharacterised protein [BD1-7 clade bacterium]
MKGIVLAGGKIGYRNLPKTASTSIKRALYQVEKNSEFCRIEAGMTIHKYFSSKEEMDACEYRFVVIRDPVKRFLSAYGNRVTHHKELSEAFIKEKFPERYRQVPYFDPGIGQFIDHFETYFKVPPIHHHFRPIEAFFGRKDLCYFTHVYPIEDIDRLASDLSGRLGAPVEFDRLQTGGIKYRVRDLSRDQLDKIIKFYARDYQLLAGYYSADDIWREWRGCQHDSSVGEPAPILGRAVQRIRKVIAR